MTELEEFRKEKDDFFGSHPQSPLTDEQKEKFQGLSHFPENAGLSLEVDLEPFPERETIQMLTSTNDIQTYQRFGKIRFQVEGEDAELTIYAKDGEFFLPFVNSLAGQETYGAGRYLEPQPMGKGKVRVDFNYAYNPYCAYNENWSCPLTPPENRLKVPIRAGERVFHE